MRGLKSGKSWFDPQLSSKQAWCGFVVVMVALGIYIYTLHFCLLRNYC